MSQGVPITWERAANVAAIWVVLLTGLAIVLVVTEELFIRSNAAFLGAGAVVLLAFILAPFIAGRRHKSSRVGWFVGLFGVAGLSLAVGFWGYAYIAIGGGP
jgi:hypothetical protein